MGRFITAIARSGTFGGCSGKWNGGARQRWTELLGATDALIALVPSQVRPKGDGEIRQAVSMVKRRAGAHQRSIREYRMTSQGLVVGRPLREFRGILSGIPEYQPDSALSAELAARESDDDLAMARSNKNRGG